MERAFNYANYRWMASEKSLYHGYDQDGVLVNTPDVTYLSEKYQCGWWHVNQENIGLPYSWGGCSSIEEFERGIAEGKFAGNVPDTKNHDFSKYTVGLDCSGLLALCWNLPKKLSTKDIPTISHHLESTNELLPADILLKPASHVMIFIKFKDDLKSYAQIIDSTRSTGKVSHRTISIVEYLSYGYKGYRIGFDNKVSQCIFRENSSIIKNIAGGTNERLTF